VTLSTEQRTQVSQAFQSVNVESASVNFNVSVGSEVPRTVTTLHSCPSEVVRIIHGLPECRYVVVKDQIVIVNPRTRRVVTVVERRG